MSNKKRTKKQSTETSDIMKEEEIIWSPGETLPKYVVVRDGLRVSDKDYPDSNDLRAVSEMNFWKKVVSRWPDGTKIEIVQYDKKKHRIW